jgi:hypothetical protein
LHSIIHSTTKKITRAIIISIVSMGRVILLKVDNIVHLDGEGWGA